MGNKAKNSKESILVDTKEMLKLYDRATMCLPKARREHGAVRRFEEAGYSIIHNFTIAYEKRNDVEQQEKRHYVEKIIGAVGELTACFEILMDMRCMTQKDSKAENRGEMHIFSDRTKLAIAMCIERIEEGSRKWRNSIR